MNRDPGRLEPGGQARDLKAMNAIAPAGHEAALIDPFGRAVTYLRVSVTDRCDLRCTYCMAEDMTFLPRDEILSLEEIARASRAFVRLGVRKLRITGGEPLVRRNVLWLFDTLGRELGRGLDELTLTTNGTLLARHAGALRDAGVRRVNVSLDTLDPDRYARLTRWGRIERALEGIAAAAAAGLHVRINAVALRGENEDEIPALLAWCGERGFDLCLIETMPLGETGTSRHDQYLPLSDVRARLEQRFTLTPSAHATGGPARWFAVQETGGRLGLITPLTNHFCAACNRVRLTATGTLYLCLGQDDSADLRRPLRESDDDAVLEGAIRAAIAAKPERHHFAISKASRPAVSRHMSLTGG